MPRVIALALAVVLAALRAQAAPPDRVVLADSDPELLHAVVASLAPWHLTVVVEGGAPADDANARDRAHSAAARFVVWREGDTLVVFDRDRDASERRPARTGAFDPVAAAAAAASVKTMMRLPPPDDGGATITMVAPVPAPAEPGLEVRLEAGGAARIAAATSARAELAAMLRPSARHGLRIGVRGDLGSSDAIDAAGFTGTWADWSVLGAAGWTVARGPWELEPWLGAGVTRGTLDGTQMNQVRREHATGAALGAGIYGRRRFGPLTAGVDVALAAAPGAPTYTRPNGASGTTTDVYEASRFSLVIGLAAAIDLGR